MAHAPDPEPLARFRDDAGLDAEDERIHHVFRALPEVEPFTSSELLRVQRRFSQTSGAGVARLPRPLLVLAAALAGAGVAAAGIGAVSVWGAPAANEQPSAPRVASESRRAPAPASAHPGTTGRASEVVGELAPETSANAPRPALHVELPAPAKGDIAVEGDALTALARESQLLQSALVKLRQQGDARGALAELDRYQLEFPHGKLLLEAEVTRVDALLRASERAPALALLERLPLERLGRGDELRVLRAELRAERDCRAALPELDALLALPLAAPLAERSLYGRAACRLQLGDEAGGRTDLLLYQARYPKGRFAERARARLASR